MNRTLDLELKPVRHSRHSHLNWGKWLPFGGEHGLVYHLRSVGWKVILTSPITRSALQRRRRVAYTGMLNLPTYYRTGPCHTDPHTCPAVLFVCFCPAVFGNFLASESLENVIKVRSLLDGYRISAESQVSLDATFSRPVESLLPACQTEKVPSLSGHSLFWTMLGTSSPTFLLGS